MINFIKSSTTGSGSSRTKTKDGLWRWSFISWCTVWFLCKTDFWNDGQKHQTSVWSDHKTFSLMFVGDCKYDVADLDIFLPKLLCSPQPEQIGHLTPPKMFCFLSDRFWVAHLCWYWLSLDFKYQHITSCQATSSQQLTLEPLTASLQ